MALVPCKVCRRHVRAADGRCPFCGTLAAAALAIGLAFFGACGGKTPTPAPGPSEIGNGSDSSAPLDAAPADARVPRGDIYGVPEDIEPGVGRGQPLYGVPVDD